MELGTFDPRKLIKKGVGDGKNTLFWKEWWTGDKKLEEIFPRLFQVDTNKKSLVYEKLKENGEIIEWCSNMREGRTMEEWDALNSSVGKVLLNNKMDTWRWLGGPKGTLTVNWYRNELVKKKTPTHWKKPLEQMGTQ